MVFDISECNYSTITFLARKGGGLPVFGNPYICFSSDKEFNVSADRTLWNACYECKTAGGYEYCPNSYNIPDDTIYVRLEWEVNGNRAWINNIIFA